MQIIIKGRQMQVTPELRQRIERKVQRLSRLLDGDARIEVTVSEEHTRSARDRFSVQLAALSGHAHPIHSEVSALNASTALDLVLDKVVTQIGRQKQKQTTVRRHKTARVLSLSRSGRLAALDPANAGMDEEELENTVAEEHNEEIWSRVMEIRRLPSKPMNDQEVIAEMEKSKAAFYPFFNEETNSVNVMYRLEDGGYGLLVPALD